MPSKAAARKPQPTHLGAHLGLKALDPSGEEAHEISAQEISSEKSTTETEATELQPLELHTVSKGTSLISATARKGKGKGAPRKRRPKELKESAKAPAKAPAKLLAPAPRRSNGCRVTRGHGEPLWISPAFSASAASAEGIPQPALAQPALAQPPLAQPPLAQPPLAQPPLAPPSAEASASIAPTASQLDGETRAENAAAGADALAVYPVEGQPAMDGSLAVETQVALASGVDGAVRADGAEAAVAFGRESAVGGSNRGEVESVPWENLSDQERRREEKRQRARARQLKMLQDFNPKGPQDTAANCTMKSKESEKIDEAKSHTTPPPPPDVTTPSEM